VQSQDSDSCRLLSWQQLITPTQLSSVSSAESSWVQPPERHFAIFSSEGCVLCVGSRRVGSGAGKALPCMCCNQNLMGCNLIQICNLYILYSNLHALGGKRHWKDIRTVLKSMWQARTIVPSEERIYTTPQVIFGFGGVPAVFVCWAAPFKPMEVSRTERSTAAPAVAAAEKRTKKQQRLVPRDLFGCFAELRVYSDIFGSVAFVSFCMFTLTFPLAFDDLKHYIVKIPI